MSDLIERVVLALADLGPWGPALFILVYVAASVTLAPAFLLTFAAGAVFGLLRGTLLVYVGAGAWIVRRCSRLPRRSHARVLRRWLDRDQRVAAVRHAVVGQGTWVMFLLRLSPVVPYVLLNYALALSGVRYRDFLAASVGMLPAIVMYIYYGKVAGDVAKLAAGVAPPRGPAVLRAARRGARGHHRCHDCRHTSGSNEHEEREPIIRCGGVTPILRGERLAASRPARSNIPPETSRASDSSSVKEPDFRVMVISWFRCCSAFLRMCCLAP